MPESPSGGLGLSYPEVFCSGPVDLSLPKEEWEQNVKGKTILITGGASGIGEATARKLAKLG